MTRPVSESFFHALKTELVHHQHYQTRAEAKRDIFEYIEVFYNRDRLHSSNNYLSPMDYEMQLNFVSVKVLASRRYRCDFLGIDGSICIIVL